MKNYIFRTPVKYILILSVFYNFSWAIEIESIHHAVDVAGKQRMFTQKMLKNYTMIGMQNSFGKPKEDLEKIMDAFENHLQSLHDFTKNKKIKESTERVKELWLPIKKNFKIKSNKRECRETTRGFRGTLERVKHCYCAFCKRYR